MSSASVNPDELYDKAYYETHLGEISYDRDQPAIMEHFHTAAAAIVDRYRPKRVLDVGCAKGFLVEKLRDRGVDAFGVDASSYALSEVRDDIREYCRYASATEPFGEHYDLVTCIEVAEHLPEDEAPRLIENLCGHTDTVLFSSTPTDFQEATHFNVQPPEYWQELFAQNGFYPDPTFEPEFVTPQAVLFRRVVRPLRVALFSKEKEEWAVVRLRVLDPLRALEDQGRVQVTFVSPYSKTIDIEGLLAADLFVVGREFADKEFSQEITEVARLLGKPIVFELDDLLTKVPRSNPVWQYCNKIAPDMEEMIRDADYITASTEPLRDELAEIDPSAPQRAVVLRNCVNTEIWGATMPARDTRADGEPLVIGWFGSPTHQDDLEIVTDAIRYIARKYEGAVEFQFFGYMPEEFAEIPGVSLARGPQVNVVRHAQGVRDAHIDVAIAPLTDHPFNHSKSDLKWLEYSICGIPGIYSNVTPYACSITNGVTGLLAENDTASWVAAIELLIRDHEFRNTMARAAFDEVRANYCVDVRALAWDDAYRSFVAGGSRKAAEMPGEDGMTRSAALLFKFQARLQAKMGLIADATRSLEAAVELLPELSGDLVTSGRRLVAGGHLAAAAQMFDAAVRFNPADADAMLALAKLHRALNDTIGAEAVLAAAEARHASDPDLAREHVEHLVATGRADRVVHRLKPVIHADEESVDTVLLVERLMQIGLAHEALEVVDEAAAVHPDADFETLQSSLVTFVAALPKRSGVHAANDSCLRLAVFTAEPMSGARVQRRLAAPLRVLERARQVDVVWSDGRNGTDAVDQADVVVIHRAFAAPVLADPVIARARVSGKAVVYEIDDLFFEAGAGDDPDDPLKEGVLRMVREADLVTVPTDTLRNALLQRVPEAYEKVRVLATCVDVETWSSVARWPDPVDRPLNIGLFHGTANSEDLRAIAGTILPAVRKSRGSMVLTQWSPVVEAGMTLPSAQSVGAASPVYLEYAQKLQTRPVDIALLPVSANPLFEVHSDATFLELSSCRIPVVCSALEPFASSVVPGDTGFLLSADADAGADIWTDAVRQLASSPQIRRKVAERAWTAVQAGRTVQQYAIEWLRSYQKLAKREGAVSSET